MQGCRLHQPSCPDMSSGLEGQALLWSPASKKGVQCLGFRVRVSLPGIHQAPGSKRLPHELGLCWCFRHVY